MRSCYLIPLIVALLVSAGGLIGCTRGPAKPVAPEPVTIPVSLPVEREVTDYVEFTGRTNAVQSVDVRPRVTGYLVKIPFKEGADVKAGDLLFEIDPRPYQAQLDQATGLVNLYQAQLKLAKINYARDRAINVRAAGSVSQQQLDQDLATEEEANARVKSYENNRETYQLNLDYTQVKSPIDGHVSRYYLTVGNLVNQDQTVLTTVVSQDPMHAYFDMDEPTLLKVRRAVNDGRIKRLQPGEVAPVLMGLQGEEGFPHEGTINFVDNQVDPTTGSILVRGVFPNPKPETGVRLLSPGMFVRIRLPIGSPRKALLVIDRALGSDQGLKYVDVVDEKGEVQYRRVTTGLLQEDGLRVISSGLKPGELVVVGGLQQVRPKMKVQTEKVPMPSLALPDPSTSKDSNPPAAPSKGQAPPSGAAKKSQG
jgi:membrane fusion protein, multidrug efflux system